MDNKRMASMFKALGDENRLHILQLLRNGEKCACRILDEMQITQPTLSHHMKILCDSEIVVGRKEGKWMHYSLSEDGLESVLNYLDELMKNTKPEDNDYESCR
ncbi:MAG: winged helix-turn-helix transcriptional regulator [Lachnospiraceae bacterium]|nr:winged helix-turn-helix transcriptional regulator [Lachnospiraceae bacterium]